MRLLIVLLASAALACAQATEPLRLDATINLPEVQGRIDHMSIDVKGQRLFVSALANNTVEVIDVAAGRRLTTVRGLAEPQGVLFVPDVNRMFVANSNDGSVRVFDLTSYTPTKTIQYGDDADNLRYDSIRHRVYVGYGGGALGEMDHDGNKVSEINLGSHPESFQLAKGSATVYVNLPKSRKVAVVDRQKQTVTTTWGTGMAFANYPMALDEKDHRLFVVTRMPARLLVFDTDNGSIVQKIGAIGDCDDVFYDAARKRIYAIGGEGGISVFQQQDHDRYRESARISTVKGARTGFFSPELNKLFVAVRGQGSEPAAVRVYAPQ